MSLGVAIAAAGAGIAPRADEPSEAPSPQLEQAAPATPLDLILGPVAAAAGTPDRVADGTSPEAPGRAASDRPVPAELVVFNRHIVTFRTVVAGYTPSERAEGALGRIENELAAGPPGEVHSEPDASGFYAIRLGPKTVFFVAPADADAPRGETAEGVGAAAASRLSEALAAVREQRSLRGILRAVGLSAGALLVLLVVLRIQVLLLRWGRRQVVRLFVPRMREVRILGLPLIDGPRLQAAADQLLGAGAWVLGVALSFIWVEFALYQFPYTRPWAHSVHQYLLDSLEDLAFELARALPGLFVVLIIILVARWLSGLVRSLFAMIERRRIVVGWLHPDVAHPTSRIAIVVLWLFAAIAAFPFIPFSDSLAFKGLSILLGIVVSFGSTGIVHQAMSGLVLMYSRALHRGEYVRIGDVEGTVSSLGVLSTKILTPWGEETTIPNSVVVGTSTMNYSRRAEEAGLMLYTSVTIGYDTPWRQVRALLLAASARTPGLCAEPAPYVLQRQLSDFFVEYQLNVRLERPERRIWVLSALHENIQDEFNQYGVQIMSPHYLGDPADRKTVARERWFSAPAGGPGGPVTRLEPREDGGGKSGSEGER